MIAEDLDMFTNVVDDDLKKTPPVKSPPRVTKASAKSTSPDPKSKGSRLGSQKGS